MQQETSSAAAATTVTASSTTAAKTTPTTTTSAATDSAVTSNKSQSSTNETNKSSANGSVAAAIAAPEHTTTGVSSEKSPSLGNTILSSITTAITTELDKKEEEISATLSKVISGQNNGKNHNRQSRNSQQLRQRGRYGSSIQLVPGDYDDDDDVDEDDQDDRDEDEVIGGEDDDYDNNGHRRRHSRNHHHHQNHHPRSQNDRVIYFDRSNKNAAKNVVDFTYRIAIESDNSGTDDGQEAVVAIDDDNDDNDNDDDDDESLLDAEVGALGTARALAKYNPNDDDNDNVDDYDDDATAADDDTHPQQQRLSGVANSFWRPGTISRQSSSSTIRFRPIAMPDQSNKQQPSTTPVATATTPVSTPIAAAASATTPTTNNATTTNNFPNVNSKYSNLSYWRARCVLFYKNGDPFFPGIELRFKPGRDIVSLEALLDKLSLRMDLPRGARYIYSMDGDRKFDLDELEDGASYVVSSFKSFKPASYGKKNGIWYATPSNQTWTSSRPSLVNSSYSVSGTSRKNSSVAIDQQQQQQQQGGMNSLGMSPALKSGSGRVIRIINEIDHTIQCRILLNLRTSQPFEEVIDDLGQVLKIHNANKMYTVSGQEVRGFSQLRNEFMDMDTFYIGVSAAATAASSSSGMGSGSVASAATILPASSSLSPPIRRSRSKTSMLVSSSASASSIPAALHHESEHNSTVVHPHHQQQQSQSQHPSSGKQRRARSKSRPRILFAPENEILRSNNSDFGVVDVLKDEPIKISIRGMRRTFFPPLHHARIDNSPPDKKLSLYWVYGYRGIDTKRNLWVLSTGELLYFVAAVAVLYDRDEDMQRHYLGHTEDILCMDLHPSREMVVSGQKSGRNRKTQAHIRIWSTETLQTLYIFGMGDFELGVAAVAFSYLNGGSYVLTAELGKEGILSVWHWQWGHLLGKVATLQEDIYGAVFHTLDDNLLITFGRSALSFWNRRKDGFFERTDIIKAPSRTSVTCLQFESEGDVITGDTDGFITVYSVDSDGTYFVRMEFEAHNKGVSALIMLSEGTLLSGGEKDRRIIAWDSLQNYKRITECKLPEMVGSVRNLYPQRPGRNDGNIYVGTTRNILLEGSMQRRFNTIVFGHSRQLWGLAVHPDDELFATAGHDKFIVLWKKNKPLWSTVTSFECVSLAFHPFGYALAVGTTDGHLLIVNTETGQTSTTIRICGSALNAIGFNPVGDMIAIASQNGSVYLFHVSRDGFIYKRVNKIRGLQPLIQFDWSTDGCFLQAVTSDYDLTYWDVKSLACEKSSIAMKDVKWYSYNCVLGYSVAGLWNNRFYTLNSLLTTANRSFAHDLLISADADGYLRLFRYPCISTKGEYHEEKVFSGPIACTRFFFNDRFVASVGGATDAALMLWQLVDD